ncbi:MAG: hypothetical protein ACIPMY_03445 [Rickettsia endosymbiont of Pentastiridius leporinus]
MIYDSKYGNDPDRGLVNGAGSIVVPAAAGTLTITEGIKSNIAVSAMTDELTVKKGVYVRNIQVITGKVILEEGAAFTNFPSGELYQNPN